MGKDLTVDLETASHLDLRVVGTKRYAAESEITIIGAAKGDNPPFVCQSIEDLRVLIGQSDRVWFHNAEFDATILSAHGLDVPHEKTYDTKSLCAYNGLPLGLDNAAKTLGIGEKQHDGKTLMRKFCKANWSMNTFNYPEEWASYIEYCMQDVALTQKLRKLPQLSDFERKVWLETYKANRRGIKLDMRLVSVGSKAYGGLITASNYMMEQITDGKITTVNQVKRISEYLECPNLQPATLREYKQRTDISSNQLKVANLRILSGSTAPKKLDKALALAYEGRAYDNLVYHGASNSRWTSKGIQLQNCARPTVKGDKAIENVLNGQPTMEDISSCVRGIVIPEDGCKLIQADLSNVEGRVLAFMAGAKWKLDLYASGEDVYVHTAKRMGVDDRMVGKTCELALGYQSGAGGLQKFAKGYGLEWTEQFCDSAKTLWRNANPEVVNLWKQTENDVHQAYMNPKKRIGWFEYRDDLKCLWVHKPCGSRVMYYNFEIDEEGIWYEHATYGRTSTYGGSLVQTWVSSVARDIIAGIWIGLSAMKFNVIMCIHDELLISVKEANVDRAVPVVHKAFTTTPPWAKGLPLDCTVDVVDRYAK